MNDPMDISVILEWENILLSEEDRCFRMLGELGEQLRSFPRSAELIVLFNPEQIRREQIAGALTDSLGPLPPGLVRLEAAEDSHYYQLKNEGAKRARGELQVGKQFFFANNFAIRRDLFLRYPFPQMAPGAVCRQALANLNRVKKWAPYVVRRPIAYS